MLPFFILFNIQIFSSFTISVQLKTIPVLVTHFMHRKEGIDIFLKLKCRIKAKKMTVLSTLPMLYGSNSSSLSKTDCISQGLYDI